jgi:hypothetical protein
MTNGASFQYAPPFLALLQKLTYVVKFISFKVGKKTSKHYIHFFTGMC